MGALDDTQTTIMTTALTPPLPSPALIEALDQLGTTEFYEPFLSWLHDAFGTEQCMVFFCRDGQKVSTLLYKDFAEDESARELAERYVSERHYLQDPNFDTLRTVQAGETQVARLDDLTTDMNRRYREAFFKTPGFLDKLAIIRGTGNGNFYINLYRRAEKLDARFDDPAFTHQATRLIAAMVSKHFQLNEQLLQEGPLAFLSEREQQVCRAVLRGKKNEAIAAELDIAVSSVITYRKRAYDKLGISSRGQLFALCS
ncbi:helix-turn-helix transcriptional regulator [Marinobacterium zhoushanense]|uniref:Helix-turn-helix transcriptional regulator n=1 Tax=Marinobacterium zhoushanense TaxID=1679163 RepID=A0ABQ1KKI1_9GAMM|nr:LuxR C-terminal-related transcriptional regulator [Marinobacterium zhoushanense]GGB99378.1 helix-turn-helix transcriptional regulator [Marinobacterium zhoushanense]